MLKLRQPTRNVALQAGDEPAHELEVAVDAIEQPLGVEDARRKRRRRGRGAPGRRQQAIEERVELVGADRLREVAVHARLDTAASELAAGTRGERDDGRPAELRLAPADLDRGREAVELRQAAIHQHEIVDATEAGLDGAPPVADGVDLMAALLEKAHDHALARRIILRNEDARAVRQAPGGDMLGHRRLVRAVAVVLVEDGEQAGLPAFAVIVDAHRDREVFDGRDDHERPQDQREDAENVLRGRRAADQRENDLERIERTRPDVAENYAERRQPQGRHTRSDDRIHRPRLSVFVSDPIHHVDPGSDFK